MHLYEPGNTGIILVTFVLIVLLMIITSSNVNGAKHSNHGKPLTGSLAYVHTIPIAKAFVVNLCASCNIDAKHSYNTIYLHVQVNNGNLRDSIKGAGTRLKEDEKSQVNNLGNYIEIA